MNICYLVITTCYMLRLHVIFIMRLNKCPSRVIRPRHILKTNTLLALFLSLRKSTSGHAFTSFAVSIIFKDLGCFWSYGFWSYLLCHKYLLSVFNEDYCKSSLYNTRPSLKFLPDYVIVWIDRNKGSESSKASTCHIVRMTKRHNVPWKAISLNLYMSSVKFTSVGT